MALHSQTASFLTFLGDIILYESLDYKLIHCTPTFIDDASKVLKIIVKKLT